MKLPVLFLSILLALSFLTAPCLAASADDIAARLSSYAEARALAASFAFSAKELYTAEQKACDEYDGPLSPADQKAVNARIKKYLEVRMAYHEAAARFNAWRAVIQLAVIDNARLPDDDVYYLTIGDKALAAHRDFARLAREYLTDPLQLSPPATKPEIKQEKTLAKSAPDAIKTVAILIKDTIFPTVNTFLELRDKIIEIRDKKSKTLLDWLDKYFIWEEWDKPNKPADTPATTPSTTPDKPAAPANPAADKPAPAPKPTK